MQFKNWSHIKSVDNCFLLLYVNRFPKISGICQNVVSLQSAVETEYEAAQDSLQKHPFPYSACTSFSVQHLPTIYVNIKIWKLTAHATFLYIFLSWQLL